MIQPEPRCWVCHQSVSPDQVTFSPTCGMQGHETCPSAVFHPLCLMSFREEQVVLAGELAEADDQIHALFKRMFGDQ